MDRIARGDWCGLRGLVRQGLAVSDTELILDAQLLEDLRAQAQANDLTVAGQVERWLRLGRALERGDSFNYQRIRRAMRGELNTDDLSAEDAKIWWDLFDLSMKHSGPKVAEFYRRLGEHHKPQADEFAEEQAASVDPEDHARIHRAFLAGKPPDELTAEEQEIWWEIFNEYAAAESRITISIRGVERE
ncbi:MAG: hypothetical protein CMN28_12260 [Salinisphaeraceae bacterium]|nr:hypothetical protein [Salinisphaeraceae bacterium]